VLSDPRLLRWTASASLYPSPSLFLWLLAPWHLLCLCLSLSLSLSLSLAAGLLLLCFSLSPSLSLSLK